MKKIIIVAVAKNGVIGRTDGKMAWHSKEDFQHFKSTTFGFPVIMGRKTFESLGKPLKGRLNIVITKNDSLNYEFNDVMIFHNPDEAIAYCEKNNYEKIFIIGGGEIYRQAIGSMDEMIISFMDFEAEGDVYFPEIDNSVWEKISSDKRSEFEIVTYQRKQRNIIEQN